MFYCLLSDDACYQAQTLPELLAKLPVRPAFNQRYVRDYLLNGFLASQQNLHETMYEGVYRVPLGYRLVKQNQHVYIERAWSLNNLPQNTEISFADALVCMQSYLKQAVMHTLQGSKRVALELSGGIDSSTVAAYARASLPQETIHALTHAVPQMPHWVRSFPKHERARVKAGLYNEIRWSKRVARTLKLNHFIIEPHESLHTVLERHTNALGCFAEVLFPLLNDGSYQHCRSLGIDTLLSGFGGDEMVSQQANLFLHELRRENSYRYYYEIIRSKKTRDWLRILKLIEPRLSAWRIPMAHLEYLHLPALVEQRRYELPRHESVQARAYDFIEGRLSLHWQRRIETATLIGKYYGINYRFPLTDPELMCFFHQLPSSYKFHNGKGRYLLRRAIEKLLPRSVVWRDDKAGGTAPAAWLRFIEELPGCFLARISPDYKGFLADYINIPKLLGRAEKGPIIDAVLLRLMLMVMMFVQLEASHYRLAKPTTLAVS